MIRFYRAGPQGPLFVFGVLFAGLLLTACAAAPPEATTAMDVGRIPAELPTEGPDDASTEEAPGDATDGPTQHAAMPYPLDCTGLSELACLESLDCLLRQNEDKTYLCTAATDDCEMGFLQRAGRREDCAPGCNYTSAQCYCAPDVLCVCGGGPPALCQAAG